MKKSDLKTGMWVELRDGDKFVVLKDCESEKHGAHDFTIIKIDDVEFDFGSAYYDDLKNRKEREFDIVKIYGDEPGFVNAFTLTECPPIFWERVEKSYLDDLLEKFPNAKLRDDQTPSIRVCLKGLYINEESNCEPYYCDRSEGRPCCWDQPLGSIGEVKND